MTIYHCRRGNRYGEKTFWIFNRRGGNLFDYVVLATEVNMEVARVGGGDEFGVLLFGCDSEQTFCALDRVRGIISESYIESEIHGRIPISVSGGYACYSQGMDVGELKEMADQALYAAKDAGRNRIIGYHEL